RTSSARAQEPIHHHLCPEESRPRRAPASRKGFSYPPGLRIAYPRFLLRAKSIVNRSVPGAGSLNIGEPALPTSTPCSQGLRSSWTGPILVWVWLISSLPLASRRSIVVWFGRHQWNVGI